MNKGVLAMVAVSLTGCGTFDPQPMKDGTYIMTKSLQSVETGDGIDKREAFIILHCYLSSEGQASCLVGEITAEENDYWIGTVSNGNTGLDFKEKVKINKHTGTVRWELGPTILDPKAIQIQPVGI